MRCPGVFEMSDVSILLPVVRTECDRKEDHRKEQD